MQTNFRIPLKQTVDQTKAGSKTFLWPPERREQQKAVYWRQDTSPTVKCVCPMAFFFTSVTSWYSRNAFKQVGQAMLVLKSKFFQVAMLTAETFRNRALTHVGSELEGN